MKKLNVAPPYPPYKPQKTITKSEVLGRRANCNFNCIDISSFPEGTDSIYIEGHSNYDSIEVTIEFAKVKVIDNPDYEKALKKYEKEHEQYLKDLKEYKKYKKLKKK